MTRGELIAAIKTAHSTGAWEALVSEIRQSRLEQWHVLFALSVEQQNVESAVYDAARLLYEAQPECPISCESAIAAMLISWDSSIEEVPWYLRTQFGTESVRNAVANVRRRVMTDFERRILGVIEYWVELDASV